MKKLIFTVEIEFEDKVCSDGDIREVMHSVADGLSFVADREGLAPEDSETFTRKIKVSSSVIDDSVEKVIV